VCDGFLRFKLHRYWWRIQQELHRRRLSAVLSSVGVGSGILLVPRNSLFYRDELR
jgi:hypothetical protein